MGEGDVEALHGLTDLITPMAVRVAATLGLADRNAPWRTSGGSPTGPVWRSPRSVPLRGATRSSTASSPEDTAGREGGRASAAEWIPQWSSFGIYDCGWDEFDVVEVDVDIPTGVVHHSVMILAQ